MVIQESLALTEKEIFDGVAPMRNGWFGGGGPLTV